MEEIKEKQEGTFQDTLKKRRREEKINVLIGYLSLIIISTGILFWIYIFLFLILKYIFNVNIWI